MADEVVGQRFVSGIHGEFISKQRPGLQSPSDLRSGKVDPNTINFLHFVDDLVGFRIDSLGNLHFPDVHDGGETPFGKTSIRMAMARGSAKTESSELMYAKPEMECFSTMGMNFDWIKSTTWPKSCE